jgi:hypothetical protein
MIQAPENSDQAQQSHIFLISISAKLTSLPYSENLANIKESHAKRYFLSEHANPHTSFIKTNEANLYKCIFPT